MLFELLPPAFTLTELQRTVEAISGWHLHKQNFRRLVEASALVEPTGVMSTQTGGRPAALFRFRREVLQERPAPGLRVRGRRERVRCRHGYGKFDAVSPDPGPIALEA